MTGFFMKSNIGLKLSSNSGKIYDPDLITSLVYALNYDSDINDYLKDANMK